MNKTIIININGIVFHIEEDAYEVLRMYMTDIKRHFAYSADSDEIVTDIENRLAEMFTERLSVQGKQVIVLQDVEEITAQMGSISDITGQDEDATDFEEEKLKIGRKLYRDPDDKHIAGVCSGVGHYFDIEPKWMRLAFVVCFLVSGIGLVVYAVLWIVLPEAKTRQEKMAMKGEPINLQNFKKNFDEEAELNFTKPNYQKREDAFGHFINNLGNALVAIIKAFIKFIGVLIIIAGVITLFSLTIGLLFSLGFWNNNEFNEFPFNVINPEFKSPLYFSAFVLVIIPLVALILFAIRVIFNRVLLSGTGSFALLVLWLTGLAMGVYYGSKIAADFKEDARFEQRTDLISHPIYYIKLNPNKLLSKEDSLKLNLNSETFNGNILVDENENEFNHITKFDLYIEKSEDGSAHLTKEFKANGGTFETALRTAQKIKYRFLQNDSTLLFDKYIYLPKNEPFRDQKLSVTLKVPVNTHLKIDGNLDAHLENHNIWECKHSDNSDGIPTEWIMTYEGLKCATDSTIQKD